jgi:putative addiction module component (TIGR02574 family)
MLGIQGHLADEGKQKRNDTDSTSVRVLSCPVSFFVRGPVVLALGRYRSYTLHMSTQSQELLTVALTLSEIERANLAGSLLRSLDPNPDPFADQAWAAEIERRVQAIDRGEVNLAPWDDVMAAMRQRRNG